MYRLTSLLTVAIPLLSTSAQSPPQWKLVEEWRVGGEPDGALSFDNNLGFAQLPNGGFVHLDWKSH